MRYETKFLNHASFYFENEQEIIIVDPWFSGKVFNDSWSLLEEVDESKLDIGKIKHIFISHEHPDHLHWETLKKIAKKTKNSTVYITTRKNKNVKNALNKMQFSVVEIIPQYRQKINDQFYYVQFPSGHDSAFIFEVDNQIHLNQNDCYLDDYSMFLIQSLYPKIDYWWMQFSLAGHYANREDKIGLQNAKKFHMDMFKKYYNSFKPKNCIPFASYIYFCKKHNKYLNNWYVTLRELMEYNPQINYLIPTIMEDIEQANNENSILFWEKLFNQKMVEYFEPKKIDDDDITILANRWLGKINRKVLYKTITLSFFEDERSFVFDFEKKKGYFTDEQKDPAGRLTKEGLLCFLKFPWGADTLNITACFDVINLEKWKYLLLFKDQEYDR